MNKHDDFWLNKATKADYADPNIPTDKQFEFIAAAIEPALKTGTDEILDFGCGYGRLAELVKKHFRDSFVIGIDINPKVLPDSFKSEVLYYSQPLSNFSNLAAIYSVAVLQHLPNDRKREFINDAAKALKKNGRLVFQYVEGDSDTFLKHDAKADDVLNWCKAAGLEVVSVDNDLIQDRWTWIVAEKGQYER